MTPPLPLPNSRAEIAKIQSERKRLAVEQAKRAPFFKGKLDHIRLDRLDDPDEWRKIPILDKEILRNLSDAEFYEDFCVKPPDGIAEYWRSGGSTGKPLFYPRSYTDIRYLLRSFSRTFSAAGARRGDSAHVSFPLGIHPVGQIYGRCATHEGITVNWAGAGTNTPTLLQLELIARMKPTIFLGMPGFALHLANVAVAQGIDLSQGSVKVVMCSAEPVSEGKRHKIEQLWGARLSDNFGMTEAGMMGAEDGGPGGFRIWTDMYFIEVLHPETFEPVDDGEEGTLVTTALFSNNVTPFLRWNSGDLVVYSEADDGEGPFSVFPRIRHAHRTTGFFKVSGMNVNHADFEDFMFRQQAITDFKCELLTVNDRDQMRVSIEIARGSEAESAASALFERIRNTFEISATIAVLESGTLAREFEASVKTPRFADKRP